MTRNSKATRIQPSSQVSRRTVLFDLDGTLTDPKEGITRSIQFALEKLGANIPAVEDLTWCIGPPLLDSFQQLLDAERAPAAIGYYRERFASVGLFENKPYKGIHNVLSQLRSQEFRLFVASSKPEIYVRQILEHFELAPYFDDIFGSELDGTRSNKSELLRFVVEETGIDPAHATMVGDRKHDMIGAAENSIETIGVLYGYGSREELTEAGANRLARATEELIPLLSR